MKIIIFLAIICFPFCFEILAKISELLRQYLHQFHQIFLMQLKASYQDYHFTKSINHSTVDSEIFRLEWSIVKLRPLNLFNLKSLLAFPPLKPAFFLKSHHKLIFFRLISLKQLGFLRYLETRAWPWSETRNAWSYRFKFMRHNWLTETGFLDRGQQDFDIYLWCETRFGVLKSWSFTSLHF